MLSRARAAAAGTPADASLPRHPRARRVAAPPLRASRPCILDPRQRSAGAAAGAAAASAGACSLRRGLRSGFRSGLRSRPPCSRLLCSRVLWRSCRSCRPWRRSPVRAEASSSAAAGGSPIQGMLWPISFSIAATDLLSAGATMVMAVPLRPARPVRPMRWT